MDEHQFLEYLAGLINMEDDPEELTWEHAQVVEDGCMGEDTAVIITTDWDGKHQEWKVGMNGVEEVTGD